MGFRGIPHRILRRTPEKIQTFYLIYFQQFLPTGLFDYIVDPGIVGFQHGP